MFSCTMVSLPVRPRRVEGKDRAFPSNCEERSQTDMKEFDGKSTRTTVKEGFAIPSFFPVFDVVLIGGSSFQPVTFAPDDFIKAAIKTMTTDNDNIPEGRAAARGTLVTLLFRLVSFACTQATLRLLDPATLGKASIQLELLLTTVLFISREGFRLALTRNVSQENWNVAWLTIPVVTFVTITSLIWHIFFSSLAREDNDYRLGGTLYCLAAWIEGCGEPAVLYYLRQMNIAKRASAEGIATVAKTITTIVGLKILDEQRHVSAFGVAQLVYALTYSIYLYAGAWKQMMGPKFNIFDRSTCYMTLVFTVQGFFKHILTEADRIVLSAMSSSYNQGVYAMGSSYGGMAARILLQPLEENARLLWSRLAGSGKRRELEESYVVLVKLVLYLGLIFSCVAVNYTNLVLCILAGRKWGRNEEAANVLSAFCVYTAFLAYNGMTEAFVYGVANSGKDVGRLGIIHAMTGGIFAISGYSLIPRYGSVGLVTANCIAMSVRSFYSIYFASKYFEDQTTTKVSPIVGVRNLLRKLLPHPMVLVFFAGTWVSTRWTLSRLEERKLNQVLDFGNKEWLYHTGQHLSMGITLVIGIITVAISVERDFIRSLRSMLRPKQD